MSCLKLHWPQTLSVYPPSDSNWQSDSDETRMILAFPRNAGRIGRNSQRELLARARILYENRFCPDCGRAAVVPVDSQPALSYRDHLPVPGTGTIVGFACESCGHEWQA